MRLRFLLLLAAAAPACAQPPATPHAGMPGMAMPADTMPEAAALEAGIQQTMHGHMAGSPHMRMSPTRTATAADSARARAIVDTLRRAIARYADTATAVAEGYRMFAPQLKQQPIYHFTLLRSAWQNELGFDPARPTSLLYERAPDGRLVLAGAMYTAPRRATDDELDARVPLGIARWHLHSNICVPRAGERARWRETRDGRMLFGPAGAVATRADCDAVGGRFLPEVFNWMVHVDVRHGDDLAAAFGGEDHDHEMPGMHH